MNTLTTLLHGITASDSLVQLTKALHALALHDALHAVPWLIALCYHGLWLSVPEMWTMSEIFIKIYALESDIWTVTFTHWQISHGLGISFCSRLPCINRSELLNAEMRDVKSVCSVLLVVAGCDVCDGPSAYWVVYCANCCSTSGSMEQSSSDHSSPSLHESFPETSIPSISSAVAAAEPSIRLETIEEVEELEVWVHIERFPFSNESI